MGSISRGSVSLVFALIKGEGCSPAHEGIRGVGALSTQRPCDSGQATCRAHPPIEPARDRGPHHQGVVDAEWLARENKRLARALQEAKLKLPQACIEAIDYPARRELDKAVIRQLASCRWIDEHQQVLVTGATGTGKSFIACALANQACRRGFRAYYRRASRLFDDLRLARADGTYGRLLGKLARMDVLLLDDWALAPPPDQERRDLLEILEDRYGSRSTIVTSQLPPRPSGMITSASPPWLTPSAIGSSTTPAVRKVPPRAAP